MTVDVTTYVLAAVAYGLFGLTVALAYHTFAKLRDLTSVHVGTLVLSLGSALPLLNLTGRISPVVRPAENGDLSIIYEFGVQGYFLFAACLCHLPVFVYICLQHWNRLVERITSPGKRDSDVTRRKTRSTREEWKLVQFHLEALAKSPLNSQHREQLAEAYLRLGLVDSAIGEYRKAIESIERGFTHARLLFKASRLLSEKQRDVDKAIPLLRRLVRLYPKSYFAAYARRVVNRYEAHQDTVWSQRRPEPPR